MSFLGLPLAAVIGLALSALAAVVALYLLKSTPRPQVVSNVDFWLRAVEQAKPSWIFSRRIPLLAMLLTLAAALLLVLLAGDPRLGDENAATTVVVLDAGRTMAVRNARGERRLDQALDLLGDVVAQSTRRGRVAVIRAGVRPSVLLPMTRDAHELDAAIDGLSTEEGPSDLVAAVALADGVVARRPSGDDARVVVISDRRPETDARRAPMTVLTVGETGRSLAIVALGARRDPTAMGEYGVYCEVRSFAEKAAAARLVIRDRDEVIAEEDLALDPGERVVHRVRGLSSDASEITARLEDVAIDGRSDADELASDDAAYAVIEPLTHTRVLVVSPGEGNRYLEAVLGVNPSISFERVEPGAWDRARAAGFDVVIFDRVLPPGAEGVNHAGAMLVSPPEGPVKLGGAVRDARVTAALASHPVLDEVSLDGVTVRAGRALVTEPEDRALFRAGRDVLATARDTASARRVTLGFALDTGATDLVLHEAFPLMMHNAVVWLANQESLPLSARRPGEPLRLPGRLAIVGLPGGEVRDVRGGAFFDTGVAGIYRVNDRPLAVSGAEVAGPLEVGPATAAPAFAAAEPPISLVVALVLLALLAAEWVLLNRGRV